jgi:hypothetical protein
MSIAGDAVCLQKGHLGRKRSRDAGAIKRSLPHVLFSGRCCEAGRNKLFLICENKGIIVETEDLAFSGSNRFRRTKGRMGDSFPCAAE